NASQSLVGRTRVLSLRIRIVSLLGGIYPKNRLNISQKRLNIDLVDSFLFVILYEFHCSLLIVYANIFDSAERQN
ncbi:hypothetical protein, partial [Vibrio harveyi]|uniref:hypothetical protein n=1 Tax=Vibrio harveyi TaxID=669 RepID=UPI001E3D28D2